MVLFTREKHNQDSRVMCSNQGHFDVVESKAE